MLEKMGEFFDRRLETYDEHMMTNIEGADIFYPFTAGCLPTNSEAKILDLGCGTGLELSEYFKSGGRASIVGIDLAPGMLETLKKKFSDRDIKLVLGSYFDEPLGNEEYDAALSVESLHHFTKDEKIPLYKRLCAALKNNGYFILTDYFSLSDDEEEKFRRELARIKAECGICDNTLYHFDTPLTVAHETEALIEAGFKSVEALGGWGATFTLKATK